MKLSMKHFDLFQEECEKYLELLGLKSWKIYYKFEKLDDSFARAEWKYAGRVATLTLANDFPKPFKTIEGQIKESALHECLEILLAPVSSLAEDRSFVRIDFDKEIHAVIRTLEKVIICK